MVGRWRDRVDRGGIYVILYHGINDRVSNVRLLEQKRIAGNDSWWPTCNGMRTQTLRAYCCLGTAEEKTKH